MRGMKKFFHARIFTILLGLSVLLSATGFAETSIYKAPVTGPSMGPQRFALTYRALFDIPASVSGEVTVTVPFPSDDEVQTIESYSFGSAMTPEKLLSISLKRETKYGNRFLEIKLLDPAPSDALTFEYTVSRKEKSNTLDTPIKINALIRPPEKQFLTPEGAKPRSVGITTLASETVPAKMPRDAAIDAIYQQTMLLLAPATRKDDPKVGQGDVAWVLENKRGDSIDFSALASEVARASGIPAKFEIGVPIPFGVETGEIGGMRAWTNLYHPQRGWIPIDPFEAKTNKRFTDYYLGRIGSDRISMAIGEESSVVPLARKSAAVPRNTTPSGEVIPMKMELSFKRLPSLTPMVIEKD